MMDKLGQEIKVGSIVAAPSSKTALSISRVKKIAKIKIGVGHLNKKSTNKYYYPQELVVLDQIPELIVFALQSSG